ncbi:MAG TPA: hypothetical protein VKM36_10990 [Balneolaceae bacterium]|nr:hypothetical protein [Balneolaceae bacterium]
MKKLAALLLVVGFLFALAPAENGTIENGEAIGEKVTVTGTLVDTKCYGMMPEANKGNEHVVMHDGKKAKMPNCATACANMGIPVAVATDDGETITIIAPAGQLADHMAKETRVTGTIAFAGGLIPDKVEVKDGKKWTEVSIQTMM